MRGKRGEFGYISSRKKKTLALTLLYTVIAVSIFAIGLLLNKMDRQNIFTVVAVLCVLPLVKQLVGFIVIIPYHSVTRQRYDAVKAALPENTIVFTDMVITSAEKIMHVDFAVVGNGQVFVLVAQGKQDVSYIREYLKKGVTERDETYRVKVFDKEKDFLQKMSSMEIREVDKEKEDYILDYLRCLIV